MIVVALIALSAGLVSLALRDGASTRLHTEAQRLGALLDAARAESRASGLAISWRPAALDDDADFRFVRGWGARAQPLDMPTRWLDRQVHAERREQRRQVAFVELVLERLGAGRDHHALLGLERVQHRRQQVGDRLADARRRLGHQHAPARERARHVARQFDLRVPLLVVRPRPRHRPARLQRRSHPRFERHQNAVTRRRWILPSRNPRPGSRP